RLEQLRVDGEAYLHRSAEHLLSRGADGVGKRDLQPFLVKVVGNADQQLVIFPAEFRLPRKPKLVAWLPDPLSDGLAQRRHDFALVGSQGIPPARTAAR